MFTIIFIYVPEINFLKNILFIYTYKKWVKKRQYYQKNKAIILQKCKKYYEKDKERLLKKLKEYYENNKGKIRIDNRKKYDLLTIEEKKIIQQKWREWYLNFDKDKKNKIRTAARDRYYKIFNSF